MQQMAVSGAAIAVPGMVAGVPGAVLSSWGMSIGGERQRMEAERDRLRGLANKSRDMGLTTAEARYRAIADQLTPEKQEQIIYGAGLVIGALDTIVPLTVMRELSTSRPLKEMTARAISGALLTAAVKGGSEESITEAVQEVVGVMALARAKGAQTAADYIQELEDNRVEIINSAIRGGIGGGAAGGGARGVKIASGADRPKPELIPQQAPFDQPGMVEEPSQPVTPAVEQAPAESQAAAGADQVEQAVQMWREAQAATSKSASSSLVEQYAGGLDGFMDRVSPSLDAFDPRLTEAIDAAITSGRGEFVPLIEDAMARIDGGESVRRVADQFVTNARALANELGLDGMTAQQTQTQLEALGIAQAKTEDEVRSIIAERARQQADMQPSQRLQDLIARTGSLTGGPEAIARSAGLSSGAEVSRAIWDGVSQGTLRHRLSGRVVAAQKPNKTAEGVRQTIQGLARQMAPMLPRGTVVKSFKELGEIPAAQRQLLKQDGDLVVEARTGATIKAMHDVDTIWIADYAMNPAGRIAHEGVHALSRAKVITDQEIKLLADRARKTGEFTKTAEATYRKAYAERFAADLDQRIAEEAAAHLIEARVNGTSFGRNIDSIIDRVLEFVRRLGNALRGMGFQTSDDVVNAVLSGEIARRERVQQWMQAEDLTAVAVRERLPDGYTPAGERDGHKIYARQVNEMTGADVRYPDYIVQKDGRVRVFPGSPENGTAGGIMDQWFKAGGVDGPNSGAMAVKPEAMFAIADADTGRSMRRDLDAIDDKRRIKFNRGGAEDEFIRDNYDRMTLQELADSLGYDITVVRREVPYVLRRYHMRPRFTGELSRSAVDEKHALHRRLAADYQYGVSVSDMAYKYDYTPESMSTLIWQLKRDKPHLFDGSNKVMFAIRDQDSLGYYSKALEAAKALPQAKGTPEQMLAMLKKAGVNDGQAMFAFAGEKAKTADLDALARAKQMDGQGVDRTAIWTDTGWFKGVDGKWRFEIDDSGAQLDLTGAIADGWQPNQTWPLDHVLTHRELNAAYPDINARGIAYLDFPQGYDDAAAATTKTAGSIILNRRNRNFNNEEAMRSFVLHEGQHLAQRNEVFARGGSGREFTPEELAAERARMMAIPDDPTGWGSVGTASGDMADLDVGRSLYRRLAGEVEARAVQTRMNLTPSERRARPPWLDYDVPEDQQIVRFADGSGPMFAMGDGPVTPGLDMSPEARKQRAEAMGFDTGRVWYRGGRRIAQN